ncbi:hypothetical protein P7K49_000006 [Saguinus oedipus]|uniref:ADP/ATP translocase n=1 Tax=Saguinus oedipus TaxID=9490 RepID=A0ABQ9WAZ7_SAGOE|nr:hypothetical protein P7K49_000006 [Saguinus oedipus]
MSFAEDFLAGAVAVAISKVAAAPIEWVKLLLRVQHASKQAGHHRSAVEDIIDSVALNFAFGYKHKHNFPGAVNKRTQFCATLQGVWHQVFRDPLDFVPTHLAADVCKAGAEREFPGLRDCLFKSYKSGGSKGVCQGSAVSVQGIIIYRAAHLGVYDTAKGTLLDTQNTHLVISCDRTVTAIAGLTRIHLTPFTATSSCSQGVKELTS